MQRAPIRSSNKYTIYDLAAAFAFRSDRLTNIVMTLQRAGVTDAQIQEIEDIVSIVATINKVVI
jgi:alkylhydroperoxidase family enzyme